MRCTKCGRELAQVAAFCPYCGEKLIQEGAPDTAPIYQTEVKGLLRSGTLYVYRDRAEFVVSQVQKLTFRYDTLVAMKKGLDRISFVMEDGRTESCTVNRKNLHEAYYVIEQACRPYLEQRRRQLQAQGIRFSFPSSRSDLTGVLGGGLLNVLDDRCEYRTANGRTETIAYPDVKSARITQLGALEFQFYDGTRKAFTVGKEQRDEVEAFFGAALAPFIEARRARLLEQGIYFSFLSSQSFGRGVLNIFADRLEFTPADGETAAVLFSAVRTAYAADGMLELALTDGTTCSYPIDRDAQEAVLAFVNKAIAPYVEQRTRGFDLSFGSRETLEINAARGVFHVLRQNGREISAEYALQDVVKAEAIETKAGRDLVSTLLSARGEAAPAEDRVEDLGVLLTVRTQQGTGNVPVCLASFAFGADRTGAEYGRCRAEQTAVLTWLQEHCPACTVQMPAPLPEPPAPAEALPEAAPAAPAEKPAAVGSVEKGQFGTLIDGIADFVGNCGTPMTIAIQGDWATGSGSFTRMVYDSLAPNWEGRIFWLHTWQFSQFDLGEQLPALLADKLIELLGGALNEEAKSRAKMVAQGVIGLVSGFISQGSSDGQKLTDAFFKDNAATTLEQKVRLFGEMVKRKAGDGKVLFFVDDLDRLAPAKTAELLNAMRYFFDCQGCVFIVAADRETVARGLQALGRAEGGAAFDNIFKTSFRVPESSFDVQRYLRDNLGRVGLPVEETELQQYETLIRLSLGSDPKAAERLFNALLLLKSVAGADGFAARADRMAVFGLLCMQNSWPGLYRCLVQRGDRLTSEELRALPAGSPLEEQAGLEADRRPGFRSFAAALCDAVGLTGTDAAQACGTFIRALAATAVTASR